MALTILGIVSVFFFDIPLAKWLPSLKDTSVYIIAEALGEIGRSHWILGYAAVASVVLWRGNRSLAQKHLVLFASVAVSGIFSLALKTIVCRPRPPLFLESGITWPHFFDFTTAFLWNSIPSGHATTGLAIAVAGSYITPRLRWPWWVLGTLIALSRIVLNVHYVSDVIAGSIIGLVVSWACVGQASPFARYASTPLS